MSGWTVEPPADPYFDRRLDAWIVSRYRDVTAALREPGLIPALARSTAPPVPIDPGIHADFRAQALRALAPAVIQQWEVQFDLVANRLAEALPIGGPIDLIRAIRAALLPCDRRDYVGSSASRVREACLAGPPRIRFRLRALRRGARRGWAESYR